MIDEMTELEKIEKKVEIYRKELLRIKDEEGLTAENVVEEAKDEESPLHNLFDWDDSSAGYKYRLQQARIIINYIVEPAPDSSGNKVPSFEIIDGKYEHINEIMRKSEWRKRVLEQSISHINYWKVKYERYKFKELTPVISEIEKLQWRNEKKTKKTKKSR